MILGFAHKGLERFYRKGSKRGVQPHHALRLQLILARLNTAGMIGDMGFPGSGLHPLKGNLKGHWAVTVSGNWRVTFRFEHGDAFDVDYRDYH
ncbi:MAG: type II toxin-antitoxin system RelE/ParE family toxin [Candidatus Lambdaproteobacteria bacterium]|nr:type II toxin-antitoxin system RelE/ParE family toxin [Candidatus Lambdaproteobacteria bacterium]